MQEIWTFLLFLLTWAFAIVGLAAIATMALEPLLEGRTTWFTQAFALGSTSMFVVWIYLLSGFWSWQFLFVVLLASELGILVAFILWELLRSRSTLNNTWGPRAMWAAQEFEATHPTIQNFWKGLAFVATVTYFVLVSIAHFNQPYSSSGLVLDVFQYTMLFAAASTAIFLLPSVNVLMSRNVDEDTRTRYLVSRLGALVPTALSVSITFWAFDLVRGGPAFEMGNVDVRFSAVVWLVVLGYFAITTLGPYLIGTKRRKRWELELLEKRLRFVERGIEGIDQAAHSNRAGQEAKIQDIKARLEEEQEIFISTDQMLEKAEEIKEGFLDVAESGLAVQLQKATRIMPRNPLLALAYRTTRDRQPDIDPRFAYVDWLRVLDTETTKVVDELSRKPRKPVRETLVSQLGLVYRDYRYDTDKKIQEVKGTRPGALLAISAAGGLVLLVPSELASLVWSSFQSANPV